MEREMENKSRAIAFLTPDEKNILTEIASQGSSLAGQRARTLLLVNHGESHMEAVRQTGLTIGQVRYALLRFRKIGLSMFPQGPGKTGDPEPASAPVKMKKDKKAKKKDSKKKSGKKEKKTKKDKKHKDDKKKKKKHKKSAKKA